VLCQAHRIAGLSVTLRSGWGVGSALSRRCRSDRRGFCVCVRTACCAVRWTSISQRWQRWRRCRRRSRTIANAIRKAPASALTAKPPLRPRRPATEQRAEAGPLRAAAATPLTTRNMQTAAAALLMSRALRLWQRRCGPMANPLPRRLRTVSRIPTSRPPLPLPPPPRSVSPPNRRLPPRRPRLRRSHSRRWLS
jgi:hypothetical protein